MRTNTSSFCVFFFLGNICVEDLEAETVVGQGGGGGICSDGETAAAAAVFAAEDGIFRAELRVRIGPPTIAAPVETTCIGDGNDDGSIRPLMVESGIRSSRSRKISLPKSTSGSTID